MNIDSTVIYDRSRITDDLLDPKNPPPVVGKIVRIGEKFDSGVFNVDINCEPGIEVLVNKPDGKWESVVPTVEQPLIVTAPSEFCYDLSPWQANSFMSVYVNQGNRDASVCARIDFNVLLEYEMPAGTTALRMVDLRNGRDKTISYSQLSNKWWKAIQENGIGIIHMSINPQGGGGAGLKQKLLERFNDIGG
jgi:hypothetical protein